MQEAYAWLLGLGCYVLAIAWIGLKKGPLTTNFQDFVTAHAKMGVGLVALSLVSTIVGSSATIGMGSLALKTGSAAFWWLGVGVIGLVFHGWLVAPQIRAFHAISLPHVVSLLVSPSAARLAGLLISVSWVAIVAAQFVALKTLIFSIVSDSSWAWGLFISTSLVIILHVSVTGQRGVMKTDALQTLLLMGGFCATLWWVWQNEPSRLDHVQWIPFNENFGAFDWVSMLILVGFTYVVGPDMFSRSLSANSPSTARWAAWVAAPLLAVLGVVITLLALANLGASSPIAAWISGDSPLWLGFKVMLGVGLVSALSGSLDTLLLSSATIFEHSVIGKSYLSRLRVLIVGFGFAGLGIALWQPSIIGLLLKAYGFVVPGVAVPLFVVLMMKRRVKTRRYIVASFVGGTCGVLPVILTTSWASYSPLVGVVLAILLSLWSVIGEPIRREEF